MVALLAAATAALPSADTGSDAHGLAETHITSTVLHLTSIRDTQAMAQLQPGVPVTWQVGISADAPDPGTIEIGFGATAHTDQLTVTVETCPVRWDHTTCPTQAHTLIPAQPLAQVLKSASAEDIRWVDSMPADHQRWVLITVTLEEVVAPGFSETLYVHARGAGDEVSTHSQATTLPATGADLEWALVLAMSAIMLGLLLAGFAKWQKAKRS